MTMKTLADKASLTRLFAERIERLEERIRNGDDEIYKLRERIQELENEILSASDLATNDLNKDASLINPNQFRANIQQGSIR